MFGIDPLDAGCLIFQFAVDPYFYGYRCVHIVTFSSDADKISISIEGRFVLPADFYIGVIIRYSIENYLFIRATFNHNSYRIVDFVIVRA